MAEYRNVPFYKFIRCQEYITYYVVCEMGDEIITRLQNISFKFKKYYSRKIKCEQF